MKRYKNIIVIGVLLLATLGYAQEEKLDPCIEKVLDMELAMYDKGKLLKGKTFHLDYTVTTIDHNGKVDVSGVKMYKNGQNMHFFSKEVDIYRNEEEMLVMLRKQKSAMLSKSPEEQQVNEDAFLELRTLFLASCEVISCTQDKRNPALKVVELKATENLGGHISIDKMHYVYNEKTGKIVENHIQYSKGYKLKEIRMVYHTLEMDSNYKFSKEPSRMIFDKKGNLLSKYEGFELIDNR